MNEYQTTNDKKKCIRHDCGRAERKMNQLKERYIVTTNIRHTNTKKESKKTTETRRGIKEDIIRRKKKTV